MSRWQNRLKKSADTKVCDMMVVLLFLLRAAQMSAVVGELSSDQEEWKQNFTARLPTWHKQQRSYLSKNTKDGGSFFYKMTSDTMYREQNIFSLLLLYVKSEHFQSSELLQSLFSRGLSFIIFQRSLYICLLLCVYPFPLFEALACLSLLFFWCKLQFSCS